jgi:hypothetical protein
MKQKKKNINSKIPNREYMTMGKLHPQVQQLIKKRISRTKMFRERGTSILTRTRLFHQG